MNIHVLLSSLTFKALCTLGLMYLQTHLYLVIVHVVIVHIANHQEIISTKSFLFHMIVNSWLHFWKEIPIGLKVRNKRYWMHFRLILTWCSYPFTFTNSCLLKSKQLVTKLRSKSQGLIEEIWSGCNYARLLWLSSCQRIIMRMCTALT